MQITFLLEYFAVFLYYPYFCMPYCFVLMRAWIYSWEASTAAQFMYFHALLSTLCPLQSVCWVIKVELLAGIEWIKSGLKGLFFRKHFLFLESIFLRVFVKMYL